MVRLAALLALIFTLGLRMTFACSCQMAASACQEVNTGSMVFIGKVETIAPQFLSHWSDARLQSLKAILHSDFQFEGENSARALASLKKQILAELPDLPAALGNSLNGARTHAEVVRVFDNVLNRGTVVRFQVKTVFAAGGGDDDDDADGDDVPPLLDIHTPFGDCGYQFQQGETYLVYATRDELGDEIDTDTCTSTKRLSDAGGDLAYLYFYKNDRNAAARLQGTLNYAASVGLPDNARQANLPAGGLVIELSGARFARYAISGDHGVYAFDGLAPADLELRVWAPGYPDKKEVLAGPYSLQVHKNSCLERILILPPPGGSLHR